MSARSPFVVSSDWLATHLNDPGMSIVDASWYLPAQERDARAEYDAGHIPRAVFFDHDVVVDPDSNLPHAIPSPATFAQHASAMGITRHDTIVVYDGPGFFSAPRVWWLFRVMGADKVYVLDGGIDGWKADGRFVTDKPTKTASAAFIPQFDSAKMATFSDMQSIVADRSMQIADARGAGRFSGAEAEPRPGMRSGHMPGARNVPFGTLADNGRFKDLGALRTTLVDAGIDPEKPVVTTCGSGVTAAVITLALASLGNENTKLYDGSWSEWGARQDTAIETGEPQ